VGEEDAVLVLTRFRLKAEATIGEAGGRRRAEGEGAGACGAAERDSGKPHRRRTGRVGVDSSTCTRHPDAHVDGLLAFEEPADAVTVSAAPEVRFSGRAACAGPLVLRAAAAARFHLKAEAADREFRLKAEATIGSSA
jgi:hypothetical protein